MTSEYPDLKLRDRISIMMSSRGEMPGTIIKVDSSSTYTKYTIQFDEEHPRYSRTWVFIETSMIHKECKVLGRKKKARGARRRRKEKR